jgi:hypothetical protein
MNCFLIDLDRPHVSETAIMDIAVDLLFDGRPMSECRGHLLSEYDVKADDLTRLMERARREVRACEEEFSSHVRF